MLEAPARVIDPVTGPDAEDLFGQLDHYRERGLLHPNDDRLTPAAMRAGKSADEAEAQAVALRTASVRIASRRAQVLLRQRVGIMAPAPIGFEL